MREAELNELIQIEYVPRKDVPKRTSEGWETVGSAVGTPGKWSVLMIRNHMNRYDIQIESDPLTDE